MIYVLNKRDDDVWYQTGERRFRNDGQLRTLCCDQCTNIVRAGRGRTTEIKTN